MSDLPPADSTGAAHPAHANEASTIVSDAAASREEQMLAAVQGKGLGARIGTYFKLSGPGWLQSAITLGGGSLAASLYLGVLGGYGMLWVQPVAMLLGLVLLGTISYVTLTTQERPFGVIKNRVNPVLAWAWLLATVAANCVWIMPQFTLAVGAIEQNLLGGGESAGNLKWLWVFLLAAVAIGVIWFYDSGTRGIKIFELLLKVVVGLIVICFVIVIVKLAAAGALPWGKVAAGFFPNPMLIFQPGETYDAPLAALSDPAARDYWSGYIVGQQRDVIFAGLAVAVGINMTFLLPYSMLARGWGRLHRGLANFDLSTGLLIPFVLVVSCVVMAAAAEFNGKFEQSVVNDPSTNGKAMGLLAPRMEAAGVSNASEMPEADRQLAAMLVQRDNGDFSRALSNVAGDTVGRYIFGIGVVCIGLSTIIVLMLINGYATCEAFGVEPTGMARRIGSLVPILFGVLAVEFWAQADAYLAVPTSVFGLMLIPIAAWTFFIMFNSERVMRGRGPAGSGKMLANGLIILASSILTAASLYAVWTKTSWKGLGALALLVGAAVVVHFVMPRRTDGGDSQKRGFETV